MRTPNPTIAQTCCYALAPFANCPRGSDLSDRQNYERVCAFAKVHEVQIVVTDERTFCAFGRVLHCRYFEQRPCPRVESKF